MPPKNVSIGDGSSEYVDTKLGKVFWTKEVFQKFVDICVRGTLEGNRKGNGWGDVGWKWVVMQMQTQGILKTQDQLKHKWDWMQKQFRVWQQLIGQETGLGWDKEKGMVSASNEWWEEKINSAPTAQARAIIRKLRQGGIGEELYNNYCILFLDKMATGLRKQSTASAPPPQTTDMEFEEGSGDSQDATFGGQGAGPSVGSEGDRMEISRCSIPPLENTVTTSASTEKKRRSSDGRSGLCGTQRMGKKNKSGLQGKFVDLTAQLKGTMKERLQVMKASLCDKPGCSITEVMADIRSLPGLVRGSHVHYMAGRIMTDKSKREIYTSYETPEERMAYLQMECEFMSRTIAYLS